MSWLWLLACAGGDLSHAPSAEDLIFLRDAVVVPGEVAGGQSWPGGGTLLQQSWRAGERLEVAGIGATAPDEAECLPLFSVELGDVSRLIAMGGAPPDTALAFSPDAAWLAIGSYRGEIIVVDGFTGTERARRKLSEASVKFVAFSPDGQTLYAAEQSPDALVHALDPDTLQSRWTVRLADFVEHSPVPPGEDLYGVYTLPSAFGLEVLADGDLVVAASHGWPDRNGVRLNRGQLLRLHPDGTIAARWPEQAAHVNLMHPRIDEASGRVAVAVTHSADGEPPAELPVGGVQVLDLDTLQPVAQHHVAPLRPYYTHASVWEGLDLSGDRLLMGLNDGRIQVVDTATGATTVALETGAPVMAGEVPIAASIGFAAFEPQGFVYLTSRTRIPWGAAASELRPPTTHPKENGLYAHADDGTLRWTWSGPHKVEGMSLGRDGRSLVVGAGARDADGRGDLFGALIFRLDGEGSGEERREATCHTASPVFFRQALLGLTERVAVTEYPWTDAAGDLHGSYRVTVLR